MGRIACYSCQHCCELVSHECPITSFDKEKGLNRFRLNPCIFMAEEVRFELTELLHSAVFKTAALNHSATLPFACIRVL